MFPIQREFRKSEQSLAHRLSSIIHDSHFITEISQIYEGFPLIANKRCGLWYSPRFDNTCYFKSTDGHTHKWTFSLNRLNLHIPLIAEKNGGCLIVDSTRKGKRFPDSFTRTIPIWCTTINRAVLNWRMKNGVENDFGGCSCWDVELHTNPLYISETEKNEMSKLIEKFVEELQNCGADLTPIATTLKKPLRAIWIHPNSLIWTNYVAYQKDLSFHPLICVSASEAVQKRNGIYTGVTSMSGYIQGAGDDEESWAHGLTPSQFWQNLDYIMYGKIDDNMDPQIFPEFESIEERVKKIVSMNRIQDIVIPHPENNFLETNLADIHDENIGFIPIGNTGIFLGKEFSPFHTNLFLWSLFSGIINCSPIEYSSLDNNDGRYIHLPITQSKTAKFELEHAFSEADSFIFKHLILNKSKKSRVLIHSVTGYENPICICLVILSKYFSETFDIFDSPNEMPTKEEIRKKYLFVERTLPLSLPNRDLRISVNRYLMTPSHFRNPAKNIKKKEKATAQTNKKDEEVNRDVDKDKDKDEDTIIIL